ncbi:MAG: SprB repeat-containing protein [Bacteroidetes bacterium]|nr:SprB repeat-containing protein [Bacteroidota bacterium]
MNVTCAGGHDGMATVLASGGVTPYIFLESFRRFISGSIQPRCKYIYCYRYRREQLYAGSDCFH